MLTPETPLREALHSRRRRRQVKQPWQPGLFVQVLAIMEKYGLQEDFLDLLDAGEERLPALPPGAPAPVKEPLDLPLFALAPPERYGLALAIIARVNNPYLHFAWSPEEILACGPLFRLLPDLPPAVLAARHFLTLLPAAPPSGPS